MTTNDEIARISWKPPPFWKDSPEIWFAQIEAQFTTANITTDQTKFNHLVSVIDSKILMQVRSAVLEPPDTDRYLNLKNELIKCFSDSEEAKLTKLLEEISLGDKKPSQLLNEMKHLGGRNANDAMIRSLWLKRLPTQIRAILASSKDELPALAEMADKIMEVSDVGHIAAINYSTPSKTTTLDELSAKVDSLTKMVETLQLQRGRSNQRSNYRSNHRSQPRSISRSRDRSICYYHRRFREAATKCKPPCSYSGEGPKAGN